MCIIFLTKRFSFFFGFRWGHAIPDCSLQHFEIKTKRTIIHQSHTIVSLTIIRALPLFLRVDSVGPPGCPYNVFHCAFSQTKSLCEGWDGGIKAVFQLFCQAAGVTEENAQVWKSSSSSSPHAYQNLTPVTRKIWRIKWFNDWFDQTLWWLTGQDKRQSSSIQNDKFIMLENGDFVRLLRLK